MGRVRGYRERLALELRSVRLKGVLAVVERALREEFARSPVEAEVLAGVSVGWLRSLGLDVLPGGVRLSVPATRSRRHAAARRVSVVVSAVEAVGDTWAWQAWGLAGLQRSRVVRWLLEVHRQGGFASLAEVAAWANLTPAALAHRLAGLRERGVWLPHVGAAAEGGEALGLTAWLLERLLAVGSVEGELAACGVTPWAWRGVLAGAVAVRDAPAGGDVAARLGWGAVEVEQVRGVLGRHADAARTVLAPAGAALGVGAAAVPREGMRGELLERYGFTPLAADLYLGWLEELAGRLRSAAARDGEVVVFAMDQAEGARATLEEARLVPVRLSFFTARDAELGPGGAVRTRVAEMKFARIERFARQAYEQGALLTLPDLAVLMGMHVDALRHHLAEHPDVLVPTRGRVKDIGRGVTHKTWIVELYLQMHSESEIVERTHHGYESVEAYLREFVRVMTLADRGMNAVMIRRVTGRSLALVKGYLELYARYDRPGHHFRLSQLRQAFTLDEVLNDKKGGRGRSRTEDRRP